MQKRYKNGLMIGKFMPPHKGHELMIKFGISMCKNMHVYVSGKDDEEMPALLRACILQEVQPDAYYFWEEENIPEPTYDDDGTAIEDWYWNMWVEKINTQFPDIDAVFTNDKYGKRLAKQLQADWCPIDIDRTAIPISASMIKEDLSNWNYLLPGSKQYLNTRICVVGPESTDKSTLVKTLAKLYNGGVVTEYGRTISEVKNNKLSKEDFVQIAKGREIIERQVAELFPISFIDTDGYTTELFSKVYLNKADHEEIKTQLQHSTRDDFYDLYLVMSPDMDWVDDGTRVMPTQLSRLLFFKELVKHLTYNGERYEIISGSNHALRVQNAIEATTNFLKEKQKW